MKKFFGGRTLLNGPGHHSTAAMVAEIQDTSEHGPKKDAKGKKIGNYIENPYPTVVISDCSRSISLEFGYEDDDEFDNGLAKLDIMIDLLQDYREGYAAEYKLYAARKKIADKNKTAANRKKTTND